MNLFYRRNPKTGFLEEIWSSMQFIKGWKKRKNIYLT